MTPLKTHIRMNTKKYSVLAVEISVGDIIIKIIGAAFLVKNKLEDGKEYIAKKILLGSL